ncbi:MAG: hypothetical protein JSW47_18260, partial [Phycisphaerales bacterium]
MKKQLLKDHSDPSLMLVFVLLVMSVFVTERSIAKTGDYLSPISVVAGVDGKVLYIAETGASQIAAFDIALDKVTKVISVGENPVGLDTSPDGSRLYVTSAVPEGKVQII